MHTNTKTSITLYVVTLALIIAILTIYMSQHVTKVAAIGTLVSPTASVVNFTQIFHDQLGDTYGIYAQVIYQSPTTVVLRGEALTTLLENNVIFWKAVDLLKNDYGYALDKLVVNGPGTENNPERFYAVMTK